MTISHMRNVKRLWYDQLDVNSFFKIKELKIEYCDELLNVFPSSVLGAATQSLETLRITSCDSLEDVFEIKDTCLVAMKLRRLYLCGLPKLKHIVWNKDPRGSTTSFQNLNYIVVRECPNLRSLFSFSIAKGLQQLESLSITSCGSMEEIVSKDSEGIEQEAALFEFNRLSFLQLWNLPYLKCFYPGLMHTIALPALKRLRLYGCEKILYGKAKSQIQQPIICIDEVRASRLSHVNFLFI